METAEPAKRANIREMVEMGESQRLGTLVEVKELANSETHGRVARTWSGHEFWFISISIDRRLERIRARMSFRHDLSLGEES
ncbi:hypothetical protein E8E14_004115 [Neopestalotiopsis sp. 37M]|nr:hypothetical protein E8E14_004115 [Neopestalotiopsis sp. 37M]